MSGSLQSGQLAVRVENVELAVILAEGGADIGCAGIIGGVIKTLAFTDDHGLQDAQEAVMIVREILQHVDRSAGIAQNRYKIRWRHLRPDEFLRRIECAQLIGGRHGGHVEVKGQQPAIFIAAGAWCFP